MKKILLYSGAILLMSACDKVTDPRIAGAADPNKLVGSNFTTNTNSPANIRKVLVEDYTGHTCGNCPLAANVAYSLSNQFPNSVVVMAVHAGNYAAVDNADGYPAYYGTPAGEKWFLNPSSGFGFQTAGNPNGMINRKVYPGSSLIESYTKWFSTVYYSQQNDLNVLNFNMTTFYDPSIRALNLDISTKLVATYTNNIMMSAGILEDSIVGPQKDYRYFPDRVANYTFNHMLRGTFKNAPYGDLLVKAPANSGDTAHIRFVGLTLDASFNVNHMWAIVFAYDAQTLEVLQAEKVRIIKSQ